MSHSSERKGDQSLGSRASSKQISPWIMFTAGYQKIDGASENSMFASEAVPRVSMQIWSPATHIGTLSDCVRQSKKDERPRVRLVGG